MNPHELEIPKFQKQQVKQNAIKEIKKMLVRKNAKFVPLRSKYLSKRDNKGIKQTSTESGKGRSATEKNDTLVDTPI